MGQPSYSGKHSCTGACRRRGRRNEIFLNAGRTAFTTSRGHCYIAILIGHVFTVILCAVALQRSAYTPSPPGFSLSCSRFRFCWFSPSWPWFPRRIITKSSMVRVLASFTTSVNMISQYTSRPLIRTYEQHINVSARSFIPTRTRTQTRKIDS